MGRSQPEVIALFSLVLASITFIMVSAQDNPPPLLTLTSPDSAHPVQFQILAEDEFPISSKFSPRENIQAGTHNVRVYAALENTGWSEGVIGLLSSRQSPDAQYVALEVDKEGVPVKNGQAFELVYQENAGDEGAFALRVLIDQPRTFGMFRVMTGSGAAFTGQTAVRDEDTVIQHPVEYQIDPQSPFGTIVLECHIIAPANSVTLPQGENSAADTWSLCGSCETCGHPRECVLDPGGQCLWDLASCDGGGATSVLIPPTFTPLQTPPVLIFPTVTPSRTPVQS
jgi:hypothetical protein